MLDRTFPEAMTALHLGAHRTGSTRLQQQLDQARELAANQGIGILTPPRSGNRGGDSIRSLFSDFQKRQNSRPHFFLQHAVEKRLRALVAPLEPSKARRIIASDEMFLGTAFSNNRPSIYPDHADQLKSLSRFLGRNVSDIHITIRGYADFITSVYAMRAVHSKNIGSFDMYRDQLLAMQTGWPEVIAAVRSVFPGSILHIWQFPDNLLSDALARQLLGKIELPADDGPGNLNASPSRSAIEYALKHKLDNDYDPDLVMQRFSDDLRFDPFSKMERSVLDERYQADLSKLAALAERDTFVLHGFG